MCAQLGLSQQAAPVHGQGDAAPLANSALATFITPVHGLSFLKCSMQFHDQRLVQKRTPMCARGPIVLLFCSSGLVVWNCNEELSTGWFVRVSAEIDMSAPLS